MNTCATLQHPMDPSSLSELISTYICVGSLNVSWAFLQKNSHDTRKKYWLSLRVTCQMVRYQEATGVRWGLLQRVERRGVGLLLRVKP